jgi:dinuclear metal center YbgI/SA1388 family protein
MRARTIADLLESIAPLESARQGDVNGFVIGSPDIEITGIGVCWTPTLSVLDHCIAQGLNLIISHEAPLFYDVPVPWLHTQQTEMKSANIVRLQCYHKHGISVYRCHTNWDVAPVVGNCDAFGRAMGWTQEVARGYLTRVYRIEPTTVGELARWVKQSTGLEYIRVSGDLSAVVEFVGTGIGGVGQRYNYPEELAYLGADAAVFGEVIDYAFRHAVELGLPLIETGHIASENFGLCRLADLLRDHCGGVQVTFFDSGQPWNWI